MVCSSPTRKYPTNIRINSNPYIMKNSNNDNNNFEDTDGKASPDVAVAVNRYLEYKFQKAGEKSPFIRRIEKHLIPMAKHFSGRTVIAITADELNEWWTMHWGHLGGRARSGIRSSLVGFWKWCVLEKIHPKEITPAEQIPTISTEKSERRILTPDEFISLAIAAPQQHRASIVLQAFCGLRSVEVAPSIRNGMKRSCSRGIHGEDIDWVNNQIRMSNVVSKSGFPRIIPLTPTARAWLAWAGVHPGQSGPICKKNLAELREFRTGWPKGALRYSYGFYRYAIIRSLLQVAEEMGSSVTILQNHCHNPRFTAEGEAWFALRPPEEIQP